MNLFSHLQNGLFEQGIPSIHRVSKPQGNKTSPTCVQKSFIALTALAALGLSLSSSQAQTLFNPSTQQEGYGMGDTVPNFTARDQFNITRSLEDYRGKWVVLDFCALWCNPCINMSLYADGVRTALQEANLPFEYVTVLLEGAKDYTWRATRGDAETWAFQSREKSPVLYSEMVWDDVSTRGLFDAFLGFSKTIFGPNSNNAAFPTWVILDPNGNVQYLRSDFATGQFILNLFYSNALVPPLVSPPPFSGSILDTMEFSLDIGGTTFNTSLNFSNELVDLGGQGLFASAGYWNQSFPESFFGFGFGKAYKEISIEITAIDSFDPLSYGTLPMNSPITMKVSNLTTLANGNPSRLMGSNTRNTYYLSASNPLFSQGYYESADGTVANTGLDELTFLFPGGLSSDFWSQPYGDPSLSGDPFTFKTQLFIQLLPPGLRMESMIETLQAGSLNSDVKSALTEVLSNAIVAMSPDAQTQPACAWLQDFISLVNQYAGSVPPELPSELAELLLETTARTKDLLDCGSIPTAIPGQDQSIRVGDLVLLDGGESYDDDTPSEDLNYSWSFAIKPDGSQAVLANADTATPSFITDVAGSYLVNLVVTNAKGSSSPAVGVLISSDNQAPTSVATVDYSIAILGNTVHFDGATSTDPENDTLTFAWNITAAPAGSTATLLDATTATPSLTPDLEGTYQVTLVVSDFLGEGIPATLEILATTPVEFAEIQIVQTNELIENLPLDQVTNKGNQNSITVLLKNTTKDLNKGKTDDAIRKLEQALERTDGCALRGSPDGNGPGRDSITDCATQAEVYADLSTILNALRN